jgi:hypothetical protein
MRWHSLRSAFAATGPKNGTSSFPHTLGVATPIWRLLDRCHRERNATEYEGTRAVDEKLLAGLIDAARELLDRVRNLIVSEKSAT